jgi:hypothetical protein
LFDGETGVKFFSFFLSRFFFLFLTLRWVGFLAFQLTNTIQIQYQLEEFIPSPPVFFELGPSNCGFVPAEGNGTVSGGSTNLYPQVIQGLINDRFKVTLFENRVFLCMADGCKNDLKTTFSFFFFFFPPEIELTLLCLINHPCFIGGWESKAHNAAIDACNGFTEHMVENHRKIKTTKDAEDLILDGIRCAHNKVCMKSNSKFQTTHFTYSNGSRFCNEFHTNPQQSMALRHSLVAFCSKPNQRAKMINGVLLGSLCAWVSVIPMHSLSTQTGTFKKLHPLKAEGTREIQAVFWDLNGKALK